MTENILDQIMSAVESFPVLPGSAGKLMTMLDDPKTTADHIEQVLRYDPGMTANLLRLCNSAYFGFPNKIASLKQAIVVLGHKRLMQLVLATCVGSIINTDVGGYDLPAGELMRHAIAVSVTAEGLIRALKVKAAEETFTAALLHDVGKMVMGRFVADKLAAIEEAAGEDTAFDAAERQVLGVDHAEIGARLMEKWGLPAEMVAAVRWHHDPDRAETPSPIVDIVHVSNVLCLMIGAGMGREGLHYTQSPAAIERLGLKTSTLEAVASDTLLWIEEFTEILFGSESSLKDA